MARPYPSFRTSARSARAIEQRVAERVAFELASLRRQFDLAQEGGQVGVFEVDMTTGDAIGSTMWGKLLGQTGAMPAIGRQDWIAMLHPDDRRPTLAAVSLAASTGCDTTLDYRIVLPDGSIRWLHSRNLIEKDADGRPFRAHGTLHDISRAKELEAMIVYTANHDVLTGLPNRRLFMQNLAEAFGGPPYTTTTVAIALFDLDHLKAVNDEFGHHAGDVVLQMTAERLQSAMGGVATVARLGGDEFAVLMHKGEQASLGSATLAALAELQLPMRIGGAARTTTASAGGARTVAAISSPSALLQHADGALYAVKRRARGGYFEYDLTDQ